MLTCGTTARTQVSARFDSSIAKIRLAEVSATPWTDTEMALGATEGTEVTVRATGPDAEEAVERLAGMLEVITPIETAQPSEGPSAGARLSR